LILFDCDKSLICPGLPLMSSSEEALHKYVFTMTKYVRSFAAFADENYHIPEI